MSWVTSGNGQCLRINLGVRMRHFEEWKLDGFELVVTQLLMTLRNHLTFYQIIFWIAHVPCFTAVHHTGRAQIILSIKRFFRPEVVITLFAWFTFAHGRLLGSFHQNHRSHHFDDVFDVFDVFDIFSVLSVFGVFTFSGPTAAYGAVIASDSEAEIHKLNGAVINGFTTTSIVSIVRRLTASGWRRRR